MSAEPARELWRRNIAPFTQWQAGEVCTLCCVGSCKAAAAVFLLQGEVMCLSGLAFPSGPHCVLLVHLPPVQPTTPSLLLSPLHNCPALWLCFFLTHTPSSTVSRALSWFRAPEKPTWIYSLTRLLSSSAVLDICGRVLGKSRGGPCSVWLCHGLGRGPLFFVFRFHNAEASEAFAIQGCQALLSRGCMQPVCGSFSGGACICTGHISPSRAYLGCQILKKQKVSRLN